MVEKTKDSIWFAEQIQAMKSSMFYTALSILHSEWDAEDAASNAVLTAYEHLDSLRDRRKFRIWMLQILRNECFDYLRKKNQCISQNEWKMAEDFHPPDLDLWNALKELNEKDRSTILLYYLEGYKVREIAQILDEPAGTVKSRLSRSRKILKRLLK